MSQNSHPIIFSGEMVRAILDGRKTQTRRIVKYNPSCGEPNEWCSRVKESEFQRIVGDYRRFCPYGTVGDRLWVRETWAYEYDGELCCGPGVYYRADGNEQPPVRAGKWRPSIFMPRDLSRITLEITGVRVERLRYISQEDAKEEGVDLMGPVGNISVLNQMGRARYMFSHLWDSINSSRGYNWQANPWVWVVEFRRI